MNQNAIVIFDACVLFPASLRDLLIELSGRAFHKRYFRAKWTDKIHDEWISSLLKKHPDVTRQALERTRNLININVPECLVTNYEHRISQLVLKDKGDRHVLAAAIECGADIIVTINLKDFPKKDLNDFSIVPMHPDEFICEFLNTYDKAGEDMLEASVCAIKERLQHPKISWKRYFAKLEANVLQRTVKRLRKLISTTKF